MLYERLQNKRKFLWCCVTTWAVITLFSIMMVFRQILFQSFLDNNCIVWCGVEHALYSWCYYIYKLRESGIFFHPSMEYPMVLFYGFMLTVTKLLHWNFLPKNCHFGYIILKITPFLLHLIHSEVVFSYILSISISGRIMDARTLFFFQIDWV